MQHVDAAESRPLVRRWLAMVAATVVVFAGLMAVSPPQRAEAAAAGPKDAIAVLFSYTWNRIAQECETTLGPAGYGYVQTSPPQEHAMVANEGNPWWIYYQPVSYRLESRMGTEAEFRAMVQRCNAAGVGVIVDAVINHMSGQSNGGTGWAGTQFQHYNYPGLYDSSDFHSCRRDIDTYAVRETVQNCNLVNLSDLDTGKASVQQKIADYLNRLADMGVKGFRFDAVKHISKDDMWGIWNRVTKKDQLYVVQEVIRAAGEPIQPEEYIGIGDIHEFAYARKMKEAFGGSRIDWLTTGAGIGGTWSGFLQQKDAATFVDNHDTERNGETLSYKDGKTYDLAQAFTLAWPYGSPSIHSGYEFTDVKRAPAVDAQGRVIDPAPGQNGWTFKHAQNDIKNMVGFRVATYGTDVVNKWSSADGAAIAFGRGSKGFVAINNGSGQVQREFTTSLPDGKYYNVIKAQKSGGTWSGETVTVAGGKFTATVNGKDAIALHVDARVASCIDSASPSVPAGVKAVANGAAITVTWNASTDDCGVSGYDVVRTGGTGGAVTKSVTGTQLIDSDLAWTTTYSYTVKAKDASGKSSAASSAAPATTGDKPVSTATTVYFQVPSGWSAANIHYRVGAGAWTTAPGKPMTAVDGFAGWFQASVDAAAGETITAAFNNGSGTWDSNGGKNYAIPSGGDQSVSGGVVSAGKPVKTEPLAGELTLYYKPSGWTAANAHYQLGSGAWTAVPGQAMAAVAQCEAGAGWYRLKIDTGSAASVNVAFNNGSGTWDSNGGKNYAVTTKTAAITGGAVRTTDPCGTPDQPVVPSAPTGVTAVASGTSATVSWSAVSGATKYTVSYGPAAGGATQSVEVSGALSRTIDGLAAETEYSFTVRAHNVVGESAPSGAVTATTGGGGGGVIEPPAGRVGTDHSVGLYKTNPAGQVGKAKTVTVDGSAAEWTQDMIIAQGVANDDPRIFRGSHEGPVYDPYALYGAWDDQNLYLMWQFTNVTDVVDPAQGYPISDNGKPYNGDIPQGIAFDIDSRGTDGIVAADEKGVWGMRYTFENKEVDHLMMFSSKVGVGKPSIFSLNANGAFDYAPANVTPFASAGVKLAHGDGFTGSTVMGVKKNGFQGYTPADLTTSSNFVDLLGAGHSKAQDTIYEIKIPLAALGIDRAYLEANGIGVMLLSTFGESAIGSLPYDPTTLDSATAPYSADASTSAEKEDWDAFTARFASVGR